MAQFKITVMENTAQASPPSPPPLQDEMSTTSSLAGGPVIQPDSELYIILSRTKSTTIKARLEKLLKFGRSKAMTQIKVEAIVTSKPEAREFLTDYMMAEERHKREGVQICEQHGKDVMKFDQSEALVKAKAVRIHDKEAKVVKEVWEQRVKYVDTQTVEML